MDNNIILTGPPRSGTTLACYLLNKVEVDDTVALHEPMNLQMFPDRNSGLSNTLSFFDEMRKSLLENGEALSKVNEGKIPSNPFGSSGEKGRESIVKKGSVRFEKSLSTEFKLIIKHNAHFTFLLPELQNYFPVYTIIRNPVSTIASWNTIEAPVARGNLKVLQTLNPELYMELESVTDLVERQVMLLDKMYEAYLSAHKVVYVRYEEIISSSGKVLSCISPSANNLSEQLESKNKNSLYDIRLINKIKDSLIEQHGSYLEFYSPELIVNYQ